MVMSILSVLICIPRFYKRPRPVIPVEILTVLVSTSGYWTGTVLYTKNLYLYFYRGGDHKATRSAACDSPKRIAERGRRGYRRWCGSSQPFGQEHRAAATTQRRRSGRNGATTGQEKHGRHLCGYAGPHLHLYQIRAFSTRLLGANGVIGNPHSEAALVMWTSTVCVAMYWRTFMLIHRHTLSFSTRRNSLA